MHKQFGALVVLDGVGFAVHSGDAIGIVGPNGAGKTTLLNVLSGALNASTGPINFRGTDVTHLDAAQRCRLGIARTHQIPRPFGGMTVLENVLAAAMHGGKFGRDEAYDHSIDAIRLCG
ncbi:MAG: ATP-binding cassette domain-containing protein, partial [Rhodoferax sp.]